IETDPISHVADFPTELSILHNSLGNLRDKVAELTLQLREKSMEVDQLVAELERSTLTHSASVQDFEDEMDRMEGQFQEENALLRD
ncbi:23967_t:CDS:2, partial [Gigaspora rosea]